MKVILYTGAPQALLQSCLTFGAFSFIVEGLNKRQSALAHPISSKTSVHYPSVPPPPLPLSLQLPLPHELQGAFSSFYKSLQQHIKTTFPTSQWYIKYCYPFPWRHVNKAWPLIVLRVYTLSYANDFVKTYVGLISLEDGIIAKLDWFIEYCLDDSIAGWTRHWCNPKSWYFFVLISFGKSKCKVWGPCFGICDDWVWKIYLVIQGFKFSKYFHCEQKMFGAVQG